MEPLDERTFRLSVELKQYLNSLINRNYIEKVLINQLFRSGTSVGANYIEANESTSKKDFIYRLKICRKEAKESVYWLRLLQDDSRANKKLVNEYSELVKIFSSIIHQ
ncbi:four helix bundle protein [Candidatus Dojkabacteria bacterium]|uniref:Four helix bundle protein n=1 Tax=Candidatus Dojkabacteria bacterium TaxID=2099670 RepID=A0A955RHB5_9BACT|nr:four helix bundle protein [Candidatus Dojkabacteria bacterium]